MPLINLLISSNWLREVLKCLDCLITIFMARLITSDFANPWFIYFIVISLLGTIIMLLEVFGIVLLVSK